jgi:hypothetical protein
VSEKGRGQSWWLEGSQGFVGVKIVRRPSLSILLVERMSEKGDVVRVSGEREYGLTIQGVDDLSR